MGINTDNTTRFVPGHFRQVYSFDRIITGCGNDDDTDVAWFLFQEKVKRRFYHSPEVLKDGTSISLQYLFAVGKITDVTLKRIASNAQTRRDSASAERWESYCQ
jgi:hypothetical protein